MFFLGLEWTAPVGAVLVELFSFFGRHRLPVLPVLALFLPAAMAVAAEAAEENPAEYQQSQRAPIIDGYRAREQAGHDPVPQSVDSKRIFVKLDSPRHYLVVAEQSFQEGKVRDCLSYVRKSFEELLNRLWKKIGNKGHSAQIAIKPNSGMAAGRYSNGLRLDGMSSEASALTPG